MKRSNACTYILNYISNTDQEEIEINSTLLSQILIP